LGINRSRALPDPEGVKAVKPVPPSGESEAEGAHVHVSSAVAFLVSSAAIVMRVGMASCLV